MKKSSSRNNSTKTKKTLLAGAAVLTALTCQTHAQSAVDALLNKLEQKGILTSDETQSLRAENTMDSTNDFNSELNQKFPMAPWIASVKFNGDFRGRFDEEASDNGTFGDRFRVRYRLRAGLTLSLVDNLEVGFSVASDGNPTGSGGDPLSNNTTLTGNGSKKYLYINTAYGKWTPINNDSWMLSGTFGKMYNPFSLTPMVFDPDYTPEGGALQTVYKFSDTQSIALNGAVFVLNDSSSGTTGGFNADSLMYGGQALWNAKWTPHIASVLGVSMLDISDSSKQLTTANYPLSFTSNQGNSRTAGGVLVDHYSPIIGDASVTYTLDSFPLYPGTFPIKLAGEFMDNTAIASGNKGWWAGVTFGQAAKKHSWDISYRYEYLQQNAWWDQVVDDDNVAYYHNASGAFIAGMMGGTNIKGHLIKADYMLSDSLTFSATCYINDLINENIGGVNEPQNRAIHFMADLMWKF
jgi:hypothetical protein